MGSGAPGDKMRIFLDNDYLVESDDACFTLFQIVTPTRENAKSKEPYKKFIGHYPTLWALLTCLVSRVTMLSEAETLKELMEKVREYHKKVDDFCERYSRKIEEGKESSDVADN